MFVYHNGNIVSHEAVSISPFDHGFLYGLGLFETFRIYNGHAFLLDDHLDRLNSGLKQLHIQASYTRNEILKAIGDLLDKNGYQDAYIRLNVSAGIGEIGLQAEPYINPNLLIFSKPLPKPKDMSMKKAVWLQIKRSTPEGNVRVKSHHFLNNVLAKKEIGGALDQEGIFLTEAGFVAEGIVSNIFWVKGHVLFTPALSTGILNGITRQFIMRLAEKKGFCVEEGLYHPDEVLAADEIFVTNSIQEIVPIFEIANVKKPGINGEAVKMLHKEYRKCSSFLWTRKELR